MFLLSYTIRLKFLHFVPITDRTCISSIKMLKFTMIFAYITYMLYICTIKMKQ